METANEIVEFARVQEQKKIDSEKSHLERNKLGQFATPPELALEILNYSKNRLPNGYKIRFLDPAFGTGSFYSALQKVFPSDQIDKAFGIEIDSQYGQKALELWAHTPLQLKTADFFTLKPPSEDSQMPNLIICTPPYVRHHHIFPGDKARLRGLTTSATHVKLNGLAGLYCYFMLYAHSWLSEGGYACWLIPSEFMDVNYGAGIKQYLIDRVTLLRIHRFDAHQVQFSDALVSSTIIWLKKTNPSSTHTIEFTFGGSLLNPKISRLISSSEMRDSRKWSQLILHKQTSGQHITDLKLSDLFIIKRGLVTGANDFFILTLGQVQKYNLPHEYLHPILPSPRYLKNNIVEADESGEPMIEEKLFLLSCDSPESQIKKNYPSLWYYYQFGVEQGIHKTYICNHRAPWYSQEYRPPSMFLCTYMGRHSIIKNNPFRFILNYSNACAANVYLLLYPKPPLLTLMKESPEISKNIWKALGQISVETLVGEGRVYGGGLYKMEPRELANASAEILLTAVPELSLALPFQQYDLF